MTAAAVAPGDKSVAFTINTNIASMQAQEYLRVTGEFQNKTINRVTSGLRIIGSGDDAAGLAIANSFRSDQAVLSQGIRNANDGLATLQTIDSGINNIGKLLDRARTLAAQSASGTFNGDRSVLNSEFTSVLEEIDRQAQAIGLNAGGTFAKNLTVFIGGGRGASDSAVITNGSVSVDLTNSTVDTKGLGLNTYAVSGKSGLDDSTAFATAKGVATSMVLNFSGAGFDDVAVTVNLTGVNDLAGLVTAINEGIAAAAAGNSASATAFKNASISAAISSDGTSFKLNSATAAFTVEEGDTAAARRFLDTSGTATVKVAGGLQKASISFAEMADGTTQKLTLSTTDSAGNLKYLDVQVTASGATTADLAADAINAALQSSGIAEFRQMVAVESKAGTDEITLVSKRGFNVTVQDASVAAEGLDETGDTYESVSSGSGGSIGILTADLAKDAVTVLAKAVEKLGQAQAVVGKGQNRFNFAVSLASTQLTNLAASESRIRDADLALEAANLTRAQILQQAGIAALAQANAAPQAVLSLLRG
jgi:flagellin